MTTQQNFHLQAEARKLLAKFTTEHKDDNHRRVRLTVAMKAGVPQYRCYLAGWLYPYDYQHPDRCLASNAFGSSEISFDDAIVKAFEKLELTNERETSQVSRTESSTGKAKEAQKAT